MFRLIIVAIIRESFSTDVHSLQYSMYIIQLLSVDTETGHWAANQKRTQNRHENYKHGAFRATVPSWYCKYMATFGHSFINIILVHTCWFEYQRPRKPITCTFFSTTFTFQHCHQIPSMLRADMQLGSNCVLIITSTLYGENKLIISSGRK
jgi:hypothetical protein